MEAVAYLPGEVVAIPAITYLQKHHDRGNIMIWKLNSEETTARMKNEQGEQKWALIILQIMTSRYGQLALKNQDFQAMFWFYH